MYMDEQIISILSTLTIKCRTNRAEHTLIFYVTNSNTTHIRIANMCKARITMYR